MTQVKIARTGVRISIIHILVLVRSLAQPVTQRLRILHTVRPCINRKHREVMAEAMLSGKSEAVVTGSEAVIHGRDGGVICAFFRVDLIQQPSGVGIAH